MPANSPARTKTPAAAGPSALLMLAILAGAAVAVAVPALAAFILVALAPTTVAWIVETPAQRYLARTVGLTNLSGMVPAAYHFFEVGIGMPGLLKLLTQPVLWAMLYGAAAIGWGVYLTVPPLMVRITRHRIRRELRLLAIRRKQIVLEWGPEAAGEAEAAPDS